MRTLRTALIGMLFVVAMIATKPSWGQSPSSSSDQPSLASGNQDAASSDGTSAINAGNPFTSEPSAKNPFTNETTASEIERPKRTPLRDVQRPYVVYPPIYRSNYGRPYYYRNYSTPYYGYGGGWARGYPVGRTWMNPNVGGGGFPMGGGAINPNVGGGGFPAGGGIINPNIGN